MNLVRIVCDEIQRDLTVDASTSRDRVVAAKLAEVETMLQPQFDFSELLYEQSGHLVEMHQSFGGLLALIPSILDRLHRLSVYIKSHWELSSVTTSGSLNNAVGNNQ